MDKLIKLVLVTGIQRPEPSQKMVTELSGYSADECKGPGDGDSGDCDCDCAP